MTDNNLLRDPKENTHDIYLYNPRTHLSHPPLCKPRANITTPKNPKPHTLSKHQPKSNTNSPYHCIPYPLLLRAFFAARTPRSSLSVTHTQNQLNVSTKANAKKTRFLSPSPPHADAA